MTNATAQSRGTIDLALIRDFLQKKEVSHTMRVVAAVLGGIVLTVGGVLLVNVLIWLLSAKWEIDGQPGDFWGLLWKVALIAIPLFFLIAIAAKGSMLDGYSENTDGSSVAGMMTRGRVGVGLLILDLAVIGPRLIVWAWRRRVQRKSIGKLDLNRAALAVLVLEGSGEGVSPVKLARSEDQAGDLERLLRFLAFYDIAHVGKKGQRVWMDSDAKAALIAVANTHA